MREGEAGGQQPRRTMSAHHSGGQTEAGRGAEGAEEPPLRRVSQSPDGTGALSCHGSFSATTRRGLSTFSGTSTIDCHVPSNMRPPETGMLTLGLAARAARGRRRGPVTHGGPRSGRHVAAGARAHRRGRSRFPTPASMTARPAVACGAKTWSRPSPWSAQNSAATDDRSASWRPRMFDLKLGVPHRAHHGSPGGGRSRTKRAAWPDGEPERVRRATVALALGALLFAAPARRRSRGHADAAADDRRRARCAAGAGPVAGRRMDGSYCCTA